MEVSCLQWVDVSTSGSVRKDIHGMDETWYGDRLIVFGSEAVSCTSLPCRRRDQMFGNRLTAFGSEAVSCPSFSRRRQDHMFGNTSEAQ